MAIIRKEKKEKKKDDEAEMINITQSMVGF